MKTYARELALFFTLLLTCPSGHAAEQDNWYLDKEWTIPTFNVYRSLGVTFHYDAQEQKGLMYLCEGWGTTAEIRIYELNGTLQSSIPLSDGSNNLYRCLDVAVDTNGTIIVGEQTCVTAFNKQGAIIWRKGKGVSLSSRGTTGSQNGEFNHAA